MNCTDFSTCVKNFYSSLQIQDLTFPCSDFSSCTQKVSNVFFQQIPSFLKNAANYYREDPVSRIYLITLYYGLCATLGTTILMKKGILPTPSFVKKIHRYLFPQGFTQKRISQLRPKESKDPFDVTFSSKKEPELNNISIIPNELFPFIFSGLDLKDLINCKLVDRRFYGLVKGNRQIINKKSLPRLLKYGLSKMLSYALIAWSKYNPSRARYSRSPFSSENAVCRDLMNLSWVLRYIDPQLGKQFSKKRGLHSLGFFRNFENLDEIPSEFQSVKFEKQEDLFRHLHTLLSSKKKDYLKTVGKFFRLIMLADTDPIDENLKAVSEDNWTNPHQNPENATQYLFGSFYHLARKIYNKDSDHPSANLSTMKLILDLINGDLFQSNAKRLQEHLDQCLSKDRQALFATPGLYQTIEHYIPHLKVLLLLLTKHTDEAMKILTKLSTDPEKMRLFPPLLGIALGTLENDEEKANQLFEYICQLPFDCSAYLFLSQKRLISYFREKILTNDTMILGKISGHQVQRIINRLRGQKILIETANKWLELENPGAEKKRAEIFKNHSQVICHLLFNLPGSFWQDPEKTSSILKMAESVPGTPGIGYATVAAIRLRALWAVYNQTERKELLADLRLQIEPTVSPLEEEG